MKRLILFLICTAPIWAQNAGIGRLDPHTITGPLLCTAASGSGTAYTCSTTPPFTPVDGDVINFEADVASTGSATLAVNGAAAATIKKQQGGANLISGDLSIGGHALLTFDGTNWQMPTITGNAPGVGTVTSVAETFTGGLVSVAGSPITSNGTLALTIAGTSGGIPYFSGATTWASSAILGSGQFVQGGGAGSAPTSGNLTGDCTNSVLVITCTQINGSNFTVNTSGLPTKVDGISTASTSTGVPVIGWNSVVTAVTANQNVTLATAPGAGDYEIHYYVDQNALCTTGSNSVNFTWNWTDATLARSLTTGSMTLLNATNASSYLSGIIPFHVNSGNVTYTSTITGTCTTGTSSYDINAWMIRVK